MLALFNLHYPLLHPFALDPQKGSHLSIFGGMGLRCEAGPAGTGTCTPVTARFC